MRSAPSKSGPWKRRGVCHRRLGRLLAAFSKLTPTRSPKRCAIPLSTGRLISGQDTTLVCACSLACHVCGTGHLYRLHARTLLSARAGGQRQTPLRV